MTNNIELKNTVVELNKKTNKLWEDALQDKDFIKKFKAVEPIVIGEYEYGVIDFLKRQDHIEFRISKVPVNECNRYSVLLSIKMDNGKIPLDDDYEKDLKFLAKYYIKGYKTSKEIIKQVEKKYEELKNEKLRELANLIEEAKNIDK